MGQRGQIPKVLRAMLHDYTYSHNSFHVLDSIWGALIDSAPEDLDTNEDFACLGPRYCSKCAHVITSMFRSGSKDKELFLQKSMVLAFFHQ